MQVSNTTIPGFVAMRSPANTMSVQSLIQAEECFELATLYALQTEEESGESQECLLA